MENRMQAYDRSNGHQTMMKHQWKGVPVEKLTHQELLKVIEWCGREIERLRNDSAKSYQPRGNE